MKFSPGSFLMSFFAPLLILVVALLTVPFATGCGGKVPPALAIKAVATYTVRDFQTATHDAYQSALATLPLLPTATQRTVLNGFASAFDQIAKASGELQNVKPGTALPSTSLPDAIQAIADVIGELKAVATSPGSPLSHTIGSVQSAVDIGGKVLRNYLPAGVAISKERP